ncbi:MAG: hypothetical protein J5I47_12660 [Vicingus serpentipes]|nr:hypothetical protein [Vicingus serpentipes]
MRIITPFFLLLVIAIVCSSSNNAIKWKLEKSKNDIQVFSFIPEGKSLKQIKSHAIVKAEMSTILNVLADPDNYVNWIYKCSLSKKIKRINKTEMVYYTQSDTPWPISDRELYVHNTFYQDMDSKIVYSSSKPLEHIDKIPLKKGVVRVTDFESKWKFTPLKNGKIAIDYYLKLDPAGKIPTWLLNMTIEIGPYETMENFKNELTKEKYLHHNNHFFE